MTQHLLYVVPISLVGFLAAMTSASAAIPRDGDLRREATAPTQSTEAPIILAQRGGRGGGGRGGGGRGGGGFGGARAGAGGFNRSAAAGSRNWSGVAASNRSI